MWQQQWTDTGKGAVTKAFFPSLRNRLRQKIPVFSEFVRMTRGQGKLRSYLHRFVLIDNAMCPCEEEEQTTDHVIFKCNKLSKQRKEVIKQIQNTGGTWPPTHGTLVNCYVQLFVKFTKSIHFADLQ